MAPTPQKLLDDLFKLGSNNKRKAPALKENQDYPYNSDDEKNRYLKKLVEQGADPTPTFLRANYIGTLPEIETLISLGADINYHKENGHCPLTYCIVRKKPKQIKLLLKHNVDVQVDFNGLNPLLMSYVYDKEKLATTEAFKDVFSIDNIPKGLFLHKIAKNNLIPQIANTEEGKKTLLHYMNDIGYNLFQKDDNGLDFFENLKTNFIMSPQYDKTTYFINDLESFMTKKHLEENLPDAKTNKPSLKI